jgi:hypothetical protein
MVVLGLVNAGYYKRAGGQFNPAFDRIPRLDTRPFIANLSRSVKRSFPRQRAEQILIL